MVEAVKNLLNDLDGIGRGQAQPAVPSLAQICLECQFSPLRDHVAPSTSWVSFAVSPYSEYTAWSIAASTSSMRRLSA